MIRDYTKKKLRKMLSFLMIDSTSSSYDPKKEYRYDGFDEDDEDKDEDEIDSFFDDMDDSVDDLDVNKMIKKDSISNDDLKQSRNLEILKNQDILLFLQKDMKKYDSIFENVKDDDYEMNSDLKKIVFNSNVMTSNRNTLYIQNWWGDDSNYYFNRYSKHYSIEPYDDDENVEENPTNQSRYLDFKTIKLCRETEDWYYKDWSIYHDAFGTGLKVNKKLRLAPFEMMQYPVSVGMLLELIPIISSFPEFCKILENSDPNAPATNIPLYFIGVAANALSRKFGLAPYYTFQKGEFKDHFIINMDTRKNGFRLPNILQWQYAMEGGIANQKYFGTNNKNEIYQYVSSLDISKKDMFLQTNPKPNRFGIHGCFLTQNGEVVSELPNPNIMWSNANPLASTTELEFSGSRSYINNYHGEQKYYGKEQSRNKLNATICRVMGMRLDLDKENPLRTYNTIKYNFDSNNISTAFRFVCDSKSM